MDNKHDTVVRWVGLLLLVAGIVLAIWAVSHQSAQQRPQRRIAMLSLTTVDASTQTGFRERMAELGHHEGRDIVYDLAGPAGNVDRLDGLLAELLSRRPQLLLVSSTPATLAAKRAVAGTGLPVVFAPVNDPVSAGIVESLKAPGGNLTGIRLPVGDQRRLQWLTELVPAVRRVAVPYTPGDGSAQATLEQLRQVAPQLSLELLELPVQGAAQIDRLLANFPAGAQAIFLPRDSTIEAHVRSFATFARSRRLPLSVPGVAQVEAGALFAYGFVHKEIGRQAAGLADQILRGTRPADLPVETAESYLALNLRTAAEIGIAIPDHAVKQATLIVR